jgi:hypothetical protein
MRKRVASVYTVYCVLSVYQTLLVSKPSGAMGLDYDEGQVNIVGYEARLETYRLFPCVPCESLVSIHQHLLPRVDMVSRRLEQEYGVIESGTGK